MSVFDLSLVWSPINKMYVLCLIYHGKRNLQHQMISHPIASQTIKNDTLNFFYYYSLYIIQLQIISHYLINPA